MSLDRALGSSRAAVLRELGILDTPPESAYDDLARLASSYCNSEIAAVNFVDDERHWTKAIVGVEGGQGTSVSADVSFCAATVATENGFLRVSDTATCDGWREHPFVTGPPFVRFYVGAAIVVSGEAVGVVCVFGNEPRELDPQQEHALIALATQASVHLELRLLDAERCQLIGELRRLTAEQATELDLRRRIEDELETSRRQYRLLAEHSTDIISRHRPDGSVTYVSPAVLEVLGYSPQEEISKDAKNHLHVDDLEAMASALSAVAQGGKATTIVRSQHADGSWRHLEVTLSPLVDPDRGVVEVYSAARDVTDRVAVAQTLERSLGLTQAVLDNVPVGIVACDERGRLTLFNPATRKFHGMSADADIDAADWADHYALYQPDGVTPLAPEDVPLRRALAGEPVQDVEIVIAPHGLPARLVCCTGQDLRGSEGQLTGAVVTMTDITAIRESDQRLRDASRLKSEFLATMSHEIRTPLNGVIGLSELLLDTELAGQQLPYAEGLRTAGHTLLAVVNDILDFSKIEAGKLELEEVAFDPCQLVEDVLGLMTGSANAKGLRLVGACSPDLPAALLGDPVRLRQILINLTSNAVKFTEAGEVVVRVERCGPPTADRVTVALTVIDSGIGISPSDQDRILQPFSQADASTTRRFGGSGLGLAICRQLAEAMGGTLSLSSQPGQGSTFRVTVPLGWHQSSEPSPPAQPTTVPAPNRGGGGLVLVVDDNTINQMVAAAMLSKLGYAPEVVSDGRQAVAAVARTRYAAVLMDCHMPVMDGYEAVEAIRAREGAGQRIPIIAMTANVRTEDLDHCLASGMDDHVSKPFTLATLERALSLWTTPSLGLDRPPPATATDKPLLAL